MNRLIIMGASGHGKVIADIARLNGYEDIIFLDDDIGIKECMGYPVVGSTSLVNELEGDVFVAIGDYETRKKMMETNGNRKFPTLVHPKSVVANGVKIDIGTVVMAGVVLNPSVTIGKGCIINTSCSVDHDCVIEDYCHISVGAHLSGAVFVGKSTWIGAGAIISNNVNICSNCLIGAGAVVVNDILEAGTYVGVPVRKL